MAEVNALGNGCLRRLFFERQSQEGASDQAMIDANRLSRLTDDSPCHLPWASGSNGRGISCHKDALLFFAS